jgi:flagellar M-ring protein FliF
MASPLDQARDAFGQLPASRKALLGGVVLGTLALLLVVSRIATAPDYALLFGSLSAEDAGPIVSQLDAQGVTYELRDGGAAIYVPSEEVYGLRLSLAGEGLVPSGPAGYELFDTGTLGMTDFMQRLNVKRALEGELARTIASIQQVKSARVHLVLPERSPFRDQQVSPSASVVLAVSGALTPDRVAGVTALVAGAVEGMSPSDVTVLDEKGAMLAGPDGSGGGAAGMTTAQLRMRQEVEAHLAGAGQSMLDQMLGPGRAVVRVSAELDLARTASETQSVDPESQTVISEEKLEEAGEGTASTSTVRNYEVTRQTTRADQEAGQVKVLTVSVLLDEAAPPTGAPAEDAPAEPTPFTAQQVQQIESLVKNAVGFDEERGDRFAVQQIRFSPDARGGGVSDGGAQTSEWVGLGVRYGLLLLTLFLAYRMLRGLAGRLNQAAAPLPAPESDPDALDATAAAAPGEAQDAEDALPPGTPRTVIESVETDVLAAKLTAEAQSRLANEPDLLAAVAEHVDAETEAAVDVIRAWLREDAAPVS